MSEARLLLLHGLLSGSVAWDRLRAALPEGVECAAPDLLGYGAAARHRKSGYNLDDLADHLEPAVTRFRPTHVFGHSMGGIVALALADRHPGLFARVGVAGLPIFSSRADGLAFLHRRGLGHRLLLHTDYLSHVGCAGMYRLRHLWKPTVPFFTPRQPGEHILAAFNHSRAGHIGALNRVIFAGLVPALAARVQQPVVALHGGRDPSAPLARVRELAATAGWELRVAPTANHQVIIERPALTARWVMGSLISPEV